MLLLLVGLFGTVLSLSQISNWGAAALIPLVAGVTLLGVFGYTQSRSSQPLIRLALLRNRLVATSLTALIQFAVLGTSVYLVLFLHHGLGSTVITAGLVLALTGMFTPLLSARTGALADRRGARTLVLPGLVLACVGLAWTGVAAQKLSLAWLIPGLLVFGVARPSHLHASQRGSFHRPTRRAPRLRGEPGDRSASIGSRTRRRGDGAGLHSRWKHSAEGRCPCPG